MKPTKTLSLFLATSIVRRSRRSRWSRSLGSLNLICLALAGAAMPASAADQTWTNGLANLSWTNGVGGNWSPLIWNNSIVDSAFFNATGAGTVTLGSAITARGLSFTANGYTINGGANILTLATSADPSSLTDGQINVNAAISATINAAIAGTVGLTKTSSGTLTLAGANTYTGATVVSGGILEAGSNTALGTTATGTTVASGTSLRLANGVNIGNEALTLNGSGFPGEDGALYNVGGGVSTYGGPITLASSSTISPLFGTMTLNGPVTISDTTLSFSLGSGATLHVNAAITGNGVGFNDNVRVVNGFATGTVNLNAVNTYLGTTTIWRTNLNANVANALPTLNGRTAVVIDVFGTPTATLNIGGSAGFPLGASQAAASLVGNVGSQVTLGSNTLTIGFGSGVNTNGTANANFAGSISGTGGLIKDGSSTQILSGTNTYSGATIVNAGTLALVGGSQTSAITVGNGAFLGFTLGSSTTSNAAVDLTAGKVRITGTPTLAGYTLMTASSITGTPVLDTPIADYALVVETNNTLKLVLTPYAQWKAINVPVGKDGSFTGVSLSTGVPNGVAYVFGPTPIAAIGGNAAGIGKIGGIGKIAAPSSIPSDVDVYLDWSSGTNGLQVWKTIITWENGQPPVFFYPTFTTIVDGFVIDSGNPNPFFYRYRVVQR